MSFNDFIKQKANKSKKRRIKERHIVFMDRSMGGKANEIIIYTNLWLLFQKKIKKLVFWIYSKLLEIEYEEWEEKEEK